MTYRCRDAFAYGNPPRVYTAGVLVGDEDPILKTHARLFEPVETHVARRESGVTSVTAAPVESATAVPGEVRRTNTAVTADPRTRRVGK